MAQPCDKEELNDESIKGLVESIQTLYDNNVFHGKISTTDQRAGTGKTKFSRHRGQESKLLSL